MHSSTMSRYSSEYPNNKAKRRSRRSTIMCNSTRQYWSDLPTELLETIVEKDQSLALPIRGVCNSWRRSIPNPNDECFSHNSRPSPFLASFPFRFHNKDKYDLAALEVVVLALHPLDPNDTSNSRGGILKLVQERSGKLRATNPLLPRQQRLDPKAIPEVINLSDYRVRLVRRCHVVGGRYSRHRSRRVRKVVVCGDTICALYNHGRCGQTESWLGFLKLGDQKWYKLKGYFQDVTVYKDKFYAVGDEWLLVAIDPLSLKVSQIVKKRDNDTTHVTLNHRKYLLVESLGDLFLVVHKNRRYYFGLHVYKVDKIGGRWMKVRDLGDRIFFVGDPECTFSLSARDLPPKMCNKWNSVYYTQKRDYRGFEAFLCNLNNNETVVLSARAGGMNIFWNVAHCKTRTN